MPEVTGSNGRVYRIEVYPAGPEMREWPGMCADCGKGGVVDVPGARCDACGRAHHGAALSYYGTGRADLYRRPEGLSRGSTFRFRPAPGTCRVCLGVIDPAARTVEHPDHHPTCVSGWRTWPPDLPMERALPAETPLNKGNEGS